MTTRRERLERKLELRREWAAKREAKATAAFNQAHSMASVIPFGQPILVGHHSERSDRNYRERIHSKMGAAVESQSMAEHHESKAEGIERQLDTCIFSDDDGAIEQIQDKIAKLEAKREFNNAVNKIIRAKPKNEITPEKLAKLAEMGASESTARQLFVPDFCGRIGIPSYVNQNLSGNIARLKKRIDSIAIRNDRADKAESAPDGFVIEGGEWVSVTFAEKPARQILDELKAAGFRWGGGSWSGRRDKLPASLQTSPASSPEALTESA